MKPILCIGHQPSVPLGVATDVFESGAIPHRMLRAWESDPWPDLHDISALIVLGGEMNVDDLPNYPFLGAARAFTERAVDAGLPVLGICLGGQMLARVLGAEVGPSPTREVGFCPLVATEAGAGDPVLSPFARLERIFQFHEDAFTLPRDATLLFTNRVVPNQAFRYGERAYGIQFHFEVDEAIISDWCDETESIESTWGTTKERLLEEARDHLPSQRRAAEDCLHRFAALAG